ncbi:MAG: nucleoside-diphosphate kinase [Proteobacteria bacterium]|jgi:nucleoside-diphosphate kinase|nr:nucleoside-diphosphate kinase [Pseudomonadota bacterium]
MANEKTLSIIKPNSTLDNNIGNIISIFEKNGLRISAARFAKLSKEKAEGFYIEHKERPFFGELVTFMTSGPVMIMVLEGDNAVAKNRELMGATNPANAAPGTIRKLYAKSVGENSVHGSDSVTSAEREIAYFFEKNDVVNRF